jgi:hypothetical protein
MPPDLPAAPRRRPRRLPPGLIRARAAAAWCSVGLRTWRSWDSAGLIPRASLRIGSVVAWSLKVLRSWRDCGCPDRRAFEAMQAAERNGQHARQHAGRLSR